MFLAPVPFSRRDMEFLTLIRNQVAIAVETRLPDMRSPR